jgi:hypothetical protein
MSNRNVRDCKGHRAYRRQQAALKRRTAPENLRCGYGSPTGEGCGQPIDIALPSTHRLSFTADHPEAPDNGGHLVDQVLVPMHMACNSRKGNHAPAEIWVATWTERTPMPHLDIYQRADERWTWRPVADNNHILATDGGQGYGTRPTAKRSPSPFGVHCRQRPQGVPVTSSKHVDVVIAHGDPGTTQAETTDQEPVRINIAPAPEWRIVLLARTKQEGLDQAA